MGHLVLRRQLRNFSQQEREQCLQELWEWARRGGGPPFSANDPRLSAVLQAERLDLLSSPKLVLE
jgi:hypothetical protein